MRWFLVAALVFAAPAYSQPAAQPPVTVGAVMPQSGILADLAADLRKALLLWQEQVNAAGGVAGRRVELLLLDDRSESLDAGKLYEQLIKDSKADLLVGPFGSAASLGAAGAAERNRRVLVNATGAARAVQKPLFRYVFQTVAPLAAWGAGALDVARAQGLKRVVLLARDDPTSREMATLAREAAVKQGFTVGEVEVYSTSTDDFSAQVMRARAAGNEAWIAFGLPQDAVEMVKTFRRLGYAPRLFAAQGAASSDFVKRVGQDAELALGMTAYDPRARTRGNAEFVRDYAVKWSAEPGALAAEGYAAAKVLEEAVRRAGSVDQEKLREALVALEAETPLGAYKVDRAGAQLAARPLLVQVQRGRREIVWPEALATAKWQPYPAWDARKVLKMSDAPRIAFPLLVTFAIQALVAFAVYSAPVMAPVAGPALGVSPSAVGYYIAASYLGSMLGSAAAGGWVARFGPIRVSQAGLAFAFAGLAMAASAWPPLVIAGGFVVGLGYGPTTPASSAILVRAAPPSMFSLVFSIKQTGVPAGGALAGALVPALILAFGWQWGAVAIGASCLALALAIGPARSRYDRELDPRAPVSLRSAIAPVKLALSEPRLRQMCLTGVVYGGVQITLVTYLVTFLVESFALSLVLAGLVMAVAQVASVTGRVVWGVLADRVVKRRTMLGLLGVGMGISALLALAAGPAWPTWLLFVYASAFGATAVGWNGVFLAEVARLAPEGRAGEATGGALFFTFLGVVVTPLLFNAALALTGSYAIAYAIFAAPSLAVGVWLLARMPRS